LKFCKSCGANLHAVREVVTKGKTGGTNESNNWLAELIRVKAIARAEEERQRGITPEVRRLREVKGGVITASVGIGLAVFLFVFMQGIILSGKVRPDAVEILARLWIVGVIPLCVGVGLMINGLFVKSAARVPTTQELLDKDAQQDSLYLGEPSERIPSGFSVTEETTRQLRGADLKE
jgi:hypothetical protein